MSYRHLVFAALVPAISVFSSHTYAYDTNGDLHEADVISAYPVYRTVRVNTPREQCWQEAVSVPSQTHTSYTPEILGGIIGAGVGRLFGSGRGQDVATVAGAVLGGSIGRDQKAKRQRCGIGKVDSFKTKFYSRLEQ